MGGNSQSMPIIHRMVTIVMVTTVNSKAPPALNTDELLEACQKDFARRQTVFTEGQLVGVAL